MTRLTGIDHFAVVTADPERLVSFYSEGLGFMAGAPEPIPQEELELLGVDCGGTRITLTLGDQRIDLERFDVAGRPYPADATAADLVFQHFAIVTTDAAAAWDRARAAGATPISRDGPVTLPDSAGGVTAVKFRDPEGHPLELLQFPPGADNHWTARSASSLNLGIDHSAISVGDADEARSFFNALGLETGDASVNHGPTQVALDGLDDVRVDVVPMMPGNKSPHLELLGYRHPRGRNADPHHPTNIAATRIVWTADRTGLIRDPAGHLHQLSR